MLVKVSKKHRGPIQRETVRGYNAAPSKKKKISLIRSVDDVTNGFIALGIKTWRRMLREKKKAKLLRQNAKQQIRAEKQADQAPAITKGLKILAGASKPPFPAKVEKLEKSPTSKSGAKGVKILSRRKSRATKWRHGRTGLFSAGPA
jgi:hypothetical protein